MLALERLPVMHARKTTLLRLLAVLALMLSSACAQLPLNPEQGEPAAPARLWGEANPQLQFLLRIHASSAAEREAMWRELKSSSRDTAATELRLALLQSIEGHAGYQPVVAESRLRALLQKKPNAEISSVARLRLLELRHERQYRAANAELAAELALVRAQLSKLLLIETEIDRDRGSSPP